MCDQFAKPPLAIHSGKPCPSTQAAAGSRRRRLWDLAHECHCPVVGVCFPPDILRRLVNKALGGKNMAGDYEVHVGAVAQCVQRNELSELLNDELDKRYALEIRAYKSAKTAKTVADLWSVSAGKGDIAGGLWAALTHPRCNTLLQEELCRFMHMLQHQTGSKVPNHLDKFNASMEENAALARELSRVQERSTQLLMEKSREIERLTAQLIQLRADGLAKDSRFAFLSEDLVALKASIPGFDTAVRLNKKVEQLTARQSELEGQNKDLRHKLASAAKSLAALGSESSNKARVNAARRLKPNAIPVAVCLSQKTVLCVGGRSGSIANYREVIERVGGKFAHHDGGLEDSQNVLGASLAAADLVICQTGCISHNAYWKVKDFCKRTGKRCVFVENPSASSLVRGLEQISINDKDITQAESTSAATSDAET